MSIEIKKNQVKESFYCVGVAYCDLQYLLNDFTKTGYTTRREGWACDVYQVSNSNFAICTGYAPIQTIKINDKKKREIIKKYNNKAIALNGVSIPYSKRLEKKRKLLDNFIKEIKKYCTF